MGPVAFVQAAASAGGKDLGTMTYSSSTSIEILAPRANVWTAITRPDLVKRYLFGTDLKTNWKIGAPMIFRGEWNGNAYEDRGTVLELEPMERLSYNYWS